MKDLTLSPTHFCTSKSDYSKVKRVNVMMDPLSLPFKKGTKTSLERILLVRTVSRLFSISTYRSSWSPEFISHFYNFTWRKNKSKFSSVWKLDREGIWNFCCSLKKFKLKVFLFFLLIPALWALGCFYGYLLCTVPTSSRFKHFYWHCYFSIWCKNWDNLNNSKKAFR